MPIGIKGFQKGLTPWNKGKIDIYSEEALRKMSEAHKGRVVTKETRKKISNGNYKRYKQFPELKKQISEKLKGIPTPWTTGEKNHSWKGGISSNIIYLNWLKNRHHYRKKASKGSHTFGEWELLKKQYGFTCPCCGKSEPEIKLTEDHIVPLFKGGSDYIENIQPLCKSCNSKKHTKIMKYKKIETKVANAIRKSLHIK